MRRVAAAASQRPVGAPAVAARGVVVAAGDRRLVDQVDLDLNAGEVVAVVGPNGAGKSTLLAALAGDRALAAGEVRVDGQPLASWSAADLSRRRAVLPQASHLAFPFVVEDVVAMGRSPWRRTTARDDDEAVIAAAMAATDVAGLRHRVVTTLSGGEQARVALARVLAQRTSVIFLDEPTAALDLRHQQLVMGVARDRADAGDAVLVVLHDLGLAGAADRVLVMAAGRLVASGPPEDVLQAELVARVYDHPVDVIAHPTTGAPVVLPRAPTPPRLRPRL